MSSTAAVVQPVNNRIAELTAQFSQQMPNNIDVGSHIPMNNWAQWSAPSWNPQFQQFPNQPPTATGWGQGCFVEPQGSGLSRSGSSFGVQGSDTQHSIPTPPQIQGPTTACAMVTPLHMNEQQQGMGATSNRRRRGGGSGGGKIVPKRGGNKESRAAAEPPGHHQGGGGRIVPVSAPASTDNSPGSPVLPRVPSNGPAVGTKAKVPPVPPPVSNAPNGLSNGPRRVDPNDGQARNYYEFMCKYAVGADFKKAEELWEKAGQMSLSANAVIVPFGEAASQQQKTEQSAGDDVSALSDEDGPPPLQDELPPPLVDDAIHFDCDASEDEGTPDGSMGSTDLTNAVRTPWDSDCEAIVQQVLAQQ